MKFNKKKTTRLMPFNRNVYLMCCLRDPHWCWGHTPCPRNTNTKSGSNMFMLFALKKKSLPDFLKKHYFKVMCSFPACSWERTCHLFGQLSGELLQDHLSLESLYLLLQELWTAAHHNPTVRTLFWRVRPHHNQQHTVEACLTVIFIKKPTEQILYGILDRDEIH